MEKLIVTTSFLPSLLLSAYPFNYVAQAGLEPKLLFPVPVKGVFTAYQATVPFFLYASI